MKKAALFLLLLAACTPVARPTVAPSPSTIPTLTNTPTIAATVATPDTPTVSATLIPTLTSTPVPPLVAHQWSQGDPLVTMDQYGQGDGGCTFTGSLPITLTLMPNGTLYVLEWSSDGLSSQIRTTKLSGDNTCQLLNSIDQAGFFDYDPATYVRDAEHWYPPVAGMGFTAISVQSWRSNSIELYGAAVFIQAQEQVDCKLCMSPDFPAILPALRKTYDLLTGYKHLAMQTYQPDRVGVWIVPGTDPDKWDAVDWPLSSPSVADLASLPEDPNGAPVTILTGVKAAAVEKMFGQKINDCGLVVMNGFDIYRVFARPLLPNEYAAAPLPKVSLSCSPADGAIQTP